MDKAMKKIFIISVISLMSFTSGYAQSIETGYHGFVEGAFSKEIHGATLAMDWKEINTIHGYQTTPHFFVGAGFGLHFMPELQVGRIEYRPMWSRKSTTEIPIFADVKWTILDKSIAPFIDLRLGKNTSNGSGEYYSIGAGCRFVIGSSYAINALLTYTTHKLVYNQLKMITNSYTYKYYFTTQDFEEDLTALSLKLGFEF